ncbi:MAG: hypothetical protein AAF725_17170 [Acidobacteriota bacterium]
MKPRSVVVLVALLLSLMFAGLNWSVFSEPSTLNLIFGEVQAPLGVLLLVIIAALSVLYLIVLGKIEALAILESRKTLKELEKARRVAETAEASRIKNLEERVEELNASITQLLGGPAAIEEPVDLVEVMREENAKVMERLDQLEAGLRQGGFEEQRPTRG